MVIRGHAIGADGAHRVATGLSTKLFRKGVGRDGQGERGDNENSFEELHFEWKGVDDFRLGSLLPYVSRCERVLSIKGRSVLQPGILATFIFVRVSYSLILFVGTSFINISENMPFPPSRSAVLLSQLVVCFAYSGSHGSRHSSVFMVLI